MSLENFKNNLMGEYSNKYLTDSEILNNKPTPILNRLQIHLDNLEGEYSIHTFINENNLKSELYLSMLYQIVYPAKSKNSITNIQIDGVPIEADSDVDTIQNIIKFIGIETLKKIGKYDKFIIKTEDIHVRWNGIRQIDHVYSFDASFGNSGTSSRIQGLLNNISKRTDFDIKYDYKTIFNYNQ